jgi:hypothetical protein
VVQRFAAPVVAGVTALPLVVVEWMDAWTLETPTTANGPFAHEPEKVTTIGWLLKDDEIGVQLANEFYDDSYRGRTFIPRAMVRSVTHHVLAKPRRARAIKSSVARTLREPESDGAGA